jgi:hypothetical protein
MGLWDMAVTALVESASIPLWSFFLGRSYSELYSVLSLLWAADDGTLSSEEKNWIGICGGGDNIGSVNPERP